MGQILKGAGRRFWCGALAALFSCTGLFAAQADDLFAKLPTVARRFGDVVKVPRPQLIPGAPFSEHTGSRLPPNDTFRPPASTARARAGTDPFTGRDIPAN